MSSAERDSCSCGLFEVVWQMNLLRIVRLVDSVNLNKDKWDVNTCGFDIISVELLGIMYVLLSKSYVRAVLHS